MYNSNLRSETYYDFTTRVMTQRRNSQSELVVTLNDQGLVTKRQYPALSLADKKYTYDARGNLVKIERGDWTQVFTYDSADRVVTVTTSGEGECR